MSPQGVQISRNTEQNKKKNKKINTIYEYYTYCWQLKTNTKAIGKCNLLVPNSKVLFVLPGFEVSTSVHSIIKEWAVKALICQITVLLYVTQGVFVCHYPNRYWSHCYRTGFKSNRAFSVTVGCVIIVLVMPINQSNNGPMLCIQAKPSFKRKEKLLCYFCRLTFPKCMFNQPVSISFSFYE